jgi:hypothetical protein
MQLTFSSASNRPAAQQARLVELRDLLLADAVDLEGAAAGEHERAADGCGGQAGWARQYLPSCTLGRADRAALRHLEALAPAPGDARADRAAAPAPRARHRPSRRGSLAASRPR